MLEGLHLEDILKNLPLLAEGLRNTLLLSFLVMLTAFWLGMIVAMIYFGRIPVLSSLVHFWNNLVRSIPIVMLIALVHFAILPLLGIESNFFFSAYVALVISTSASVSEILRGGFAALHREEREAAISLGLTPLQRLHHVFAPLALYRMSPALINQFVTLIKDTALASIIGVVELTRAAEIIYQRTLHDVTLLVFIAVIYFLLCYGLSCAARAAQRVSMLPE